MLAKKFAVGFGVAIILPMLVHYGVSTFSPRPKWQDYQMEDYYQRHKDASPEEKTRLKEERDRLNQERDKHRKRFERHLFFVAVPIGIAALIFGAIASVQAIGTGLMFGGILPW